MNLRTHAFEILSCAINSVHPSNLIKQSVKLNEAYLLINNHSFDLKKYTKIIVVGAGKASASMALELENILKDKIAAGLVVTNYGNYVSCKTIEICEAGHPFTDENGISAAKKILKLVKNVTENDLVISLISGGASALMELPVDGVILKDIIELNELLLSSGAEIQEINSVRKHLSQIKGGQLSKHIYPATCLSLIISDVIGNPLDIIASGPTCADRSTFADAWQVINKYDLQDSIQQNVRSYLKSGLKEKTKETPKPGDPYLKKTTNVIIGSIEIAKTEAIKTANNLGYNPILVDEPIQGEARLAAKKIAALIKKQNCDKPTAIIWGGETTVTLKGKGKGGRNQEFVLAVLQEIKQSLKTPFVLLSCGTDGRDGPTDAAGAIIDEFTFKNSKKKSLDTSIFLENNDSYTFFEKVNGLIKIGATGTNVMDIGFFLT
jgi:glycerate 2-kinase